jgi:hypothetical protein
MITERLHRYSVLWRMASRPRGVREPSPVFKTSWLVERLFVCFIRWNYHAEEGESIPVASERGRSHLALVHGGCPNALSRTTCREDEGRRPPAHPNE